MPDALLSREIRMKSIYGAFALVVSLLALPGTTLAAPTDIATLPILNLDDTGAVKPNLMLLYDNSGSMVSAFTPDYVDDGSTCRKFSSMAGGTISCLNGHPPFNSADFNRQYYDPKTLYLPPVDYKGVSYQSQDRKATTDWTVVSNDAFGVNKKNLLNVASDSTNLAAGFPDLNWCDANGNCSINSATYTYPNDTIFTSSNVFGNPYYYTIQVAEYCSDDNLTKCVTTPVGASAPAGFSKPAKVRWCDTTALTNCQAKYVGKFIYPRFSRPTGGTFAYGTIMIGATIVTTSVDIRSVTVTEAGNKVVTITNGTTSAANGTTTPADQAKLAEALAASIVARTGLANQYTACVYKPAGTVVKSCLSYGISLPVSNNMVAVIPLSCATGARGKSDCTMLTDTSREGWKLTVDAPDAPVSGTKAAVATLAVDGQAANSTRSPSTLASLTLNKTALLTTAMTFAANASSAAVATAIADKINANKIAGITASVNCAGTNNRTVCISTTASYAGGQVLAYGALTNKGTLSLTAKDTTAGVPPTSKVPTTAVALGAGASVFVRTDIVPTNDSYPKADTRTDCMAAASCTYDEEMTNFANWYTYYRTRNQMMKTSVGLAFKSITDNFNVGIIDLFTAAKEGAMGIPRPFSGTNRQNWYTTLYGMNGDQSTPLRPALNAIGKMYANVSPYEIKETKSQAIQYPCQQNYTFMTTDGYWNGGAAKGLTVDRKTVLDDPANNDNVENAQRFCLASTGCVDKSDQTYNSLADVALYWYNGGTNGVTSSLRTDLEPASGGIVPGKPGENTKLHMNTYTLGLGVDGVMKYEENYDVGAEQGGDFYKLTHGVQTGCPWNNGGPYVWPDPLTDVTSTSAAYQSRVDDLWHTAINGHGKYFSASSPSQVINGLRSALSNIIAHSGAAAAAATSTPNISLNDNDLFSNTFTTVQWSGELTDKKVDPITGVVGTDIIWNTSDTLGLRVGPASDTRKILMLDTVEGGFKDFVYDTLTDDEKKWFDGKCNLLAQCTSMTATQRDVANSGAAVVNWLRGQQQYANGIVFRAYGKRAAAGSAATVPLILGDIASSKPAYVREPRKSYQVDGYSDFIVANAKRNPTVYVGANDGMLHAFDTKNGNELWAYMPRITMSKLYSQADTTYGTKHQYTVDGSPETGDVKIGGKWRTVLVSGLAGGGRGYFALDVTDPDNPAPLWETCADPKVCKGDNNEPELGLTFGNPQTGLWKDATGPAKWVVFVTSGYNNIPDGTSKGSGKGWLMILDIETGKVLKKVATLTGTATDAAIAATPVGLARTTAITKNPNTDPLVTYIYGGDVQGQMWRFDLTPPGAPTVVKMGDAGVLQPITARPDVTYCEVTKTTNGVTSKINQVVVGFGTGRLLSVGDLSTKDQQSLYVLRDDSVDLTKEALRGSSMAKQTLTKVEVKDQPTYYTAAGKAADLATQKGWYVDFDKLTGERVNLDPLIAQGGINVVTNTPDTSTSCKVGGSSILYTFDVCTGKVGSSGGSGSGNNSGTGGTGGSGGSDGDGGVAGRIIPGGAAAAGFSIVSTATGLVAEVKLVNGVDVPIALDKLKKPVSRRSGWRRIRN
jgi:type IV pilus assembly protein PilY1